MLLSSKVVRCLSSINIPRSSQAQGASEGAPGPTGPVHLGRTAEQLGGACQSLPVVTATGSVPVNASALESVPLH